MNAFELYEAVFDSANEYAQATTEYVSQYAENALDKHISSDVANQIIECHIAFKNKGNGNNDYFHMVEKPLSAIEI